MSVITFLQEFTICIFKGEVGGGREGEGGKGKGEGWKAKIIIQDFK